MTTNTLCPGGQFVLHAKALSDNRYDGHTLREGSGDTRALAAKYNATMLIRACGHDTDIPRRVFISGQKRDVFCIIKRCAVDLPLSGWSVTSKLKVILDAAISKAVPETPSMPFSRVRYNFRPHPRMPVGFFSPLPKNVRAPVIRSALNQAY